MRFLEHELLGEGGFGTVLRAHDRELGVDVALKRLRADAVASGERLKDEFRALAHFAHPHVVTLHELHDDDAGVFMTMELVADDRMTRQQGPWPEAERRALFCQAANALQALHASGLVHGDIKPGNVLHSPDGRTVLTDFGFTGIMGGVMGGRSSPGLTPAYAAPELFFGATPSAASDLYALGVMLHDSVSPTPAFEGPLPAIVWVKDKAPHVKPTHGPEDIQDLIIALTRRDPLARPSAAEVERRLGTGLPSSVTRPWLHRTLRMVGRDAELARLSALATLAESGTRTLAVLRGAPGIGKTALLETLAARLDARVLRCYPNDRQVGALASELEHDDSRPPVLVCIEDLQHCDPLSLVALVQLFNRVPEGKGLLVLVSARPDERLEKELIALVRDTGSKCTLTTIPIAPLGHEASVELAMQALGPAEKPRSELVAAAGGNPLALSLIGVEGTKDLIATLSPAARTVLELVVASRNALPVGVLMRAAGLDSAKYLAELQRLRIARLVTTTVESGRGALIRVAHQVVADAVDSGSPELQRRLAEGFLAHADGPMGDAARTGAALSLAAAGDITRATKIALDVAAAARARNDHEREAHMLGLALRSPELADRRQHALRLADALISARRLGEAGRLLKTLIADAPAAEVPALTHRAAEALLFGAEIREARELLASTLNSIDVTIPKRVLPTAIRILIFYRRSFAKTLPELPAPKTPDAERLDVLHSAALGFAMFDPLNSAWFQVLHLKAALKSGGPAERVRALAIHLVHSATSFVDTKRQDVTNARIEREMSHLGNAQRADLQVSVDVARAAAAWVLGDFADARTLSETASELAARRSGHTWEADTVLLVRSAVAEESGDWANLASWVDEGMTNALARGDRYLQLNLRARPVSFLRLVAGDPTAGIEASEWASNEWPGDAGLLMLWVYLARVRCALYEGDAARAVKEAEDGLAALKRAFLLHSHYHAGMIHYARMNAALQVGEVKRAQKLGKTVQGFCTEAQSRAAQALLSVQRGDIAGAIASLEATGQIGLASLLRASDGEASAHSSLVSIGVREPAKLARALVLPSKRSTS